MGMQRYGDDACHEVCNGEDCYRTREYGEVSLTCGIPEDYDMCDWQANIVHRYITEMQENIAGEMAGIDAEIAELLEHEALILKFCPEH